MEFSIDHLGIAVKSLAAAKSIYEKLGLSVSPEETVEQEKVRLVMVPVGESRLELLEATSDDSTIARFIAKRGKVLQSPGVIHIVGNNREQVPVPDAEIELLRSGVRGRNMEPYRELVVGKKRRRS